MTRREFLISLITAGGLVVTIGALYVAAGTKRRQDARQFNDNMGVIEGHVLDAEGQPVQNVTVYAQKVNLIKGVIPSDETDEQGRFRISNLTPGTYKVYAASGAAGHSQAVLSFYSGSSEDAPEVIVDEQQTTSDVVVHVGPKAATLAGRILDATTNQPVASARVLLRRTDIREGLYLTGPDQQGRFNIPVPHVPFTVSVSAPGYEDWDSKNNLSSNQTGVLQLAPGTEKDLTVSLQPVKKVAKD